MNHKKCSRCGIVKDFGSFYKNKNMKYGLQGQCKDCNREYQRENKEERAEYKRNYYKSNKESIETKKRKYQSENKEKIAEYKRRYGKENAEYIAIKRREYRQTEKGKASEIARSVKSALKFPQKRKARIAVSNAIRLGKLIRQPCEVCGADNKIQAHHPDYSQPLIVTWLCMKHHVALHVELR
jgi:murein L,D-transpeptidase YcbB/YkuD